MTGAIQTTRNWLLATAICLAAVSAPLDLRDRNTSVLAASMVSVFAVLGPRLRRRIRRPGLSSANGNEIEFAALRQYAPTTLVDRVIHGHRLDCGEQEVTIMFVDLSGYTAFAEDLNPEEVFSFISRFTLVVSRAISENGGYVVEFNGDGMMAVFGSPSQQPHKERAALRAARSILDAVSSLEASSMRRGLGVPPAEIGLATGPAFVGNIRTADRCIWSAVGSTTNRASRLQRLAREFGAAIVIDSTTRAAVGPDSQLIGIPQVRIRGIRTPVDLFAHPQPGAENALALRARDAFDVRHAREGRHEPRLCLVPSAHSR